MIVPEGWSLILVPACLGVAAAALGWPVVGWSALAFSAVCVLVFRDPPRAFEGSSGEACSPADGTVELVGRGSRDDEVCWRVVIRIPPFAPQVTRLPIAGRLENVTREAAAGWLLRECVTSAWQTPHGRVVLRQIAGRFGRRVVFDHPIGAWVDRAARVGVLRFGSRVEVELPAAAEPLIAVGDRVRAGSAAVARMAS